MPTNTFAAGQVIESAKINQNFLEVQPRTYSTTATSATTTTLTVNSNFQQNFTGATTQNCDLPATNTMTLGYGFLITNLSSGVVTLRTSSGTTVQAMAANTQLLIWCVSTGNLGTTAEWKWAYYPLGTVPATMGGTGQTGYTAGDILYASSASALAALAGAAGVLQGQVGGAPAYTQAPTLTTPSMTTPTVSAGINLTGGKISFPATQAASAGANDLDDYEEGTFTPITQGAGSAGTGTYSTQNGWYTKIGQMVYFSLRVQTTAHTGTGDIRVGGLPFTAQNITSGNAGFCSILLDSYTVTAGHVVTAGYVIPNDTKLTFYSVATGGGATTNVAIDAVCTIMISGFYKI
jgi:hypothetical protein